MIDLKNKKVLFWGTSFFDFDDSITDALRGYGATVYYCSSALTNIKKRVFLRLHNVQKAQNAVSKKLLMLIEEQPRDVDYILVIKAENFQKKHVEKLFSQYPNVPTVLYLWDSLKWLENRDVLLRYFKTIYTFDRIDAQNFNLRFRPLFFRSQEEKLKGIKPCYDITFVGSWHTQRYDFLQKLIPQLIANNLNYKFFLRGGRFSIFVNKYITRKIKKEHFDFFISEPISYNEYLNLCINSKVILDIANPCQSGLTMRSIEVLGMGRKLLTTNTDIVNYNIDNNMYEVINLENPVIDYTFFINENQSALDSARFSLNSFIEEIFNGFNEKDA